MLYGIFVPFSLSVMIIEACNAHGIHVERLDNNVLGFLTPFQRVKALAATHVHVGALLDSANRQPRALAA